MLSKKYPSSLEGRGGDEVDGVRCLPFTGVDCLASIDFTCLITNLHDFWLASIAKASRSLLGTRLSVPSTSSGPKKSLSGLCGFASFARDRNSGRAALSMDASQKLGLAQRSQSRKGVFNESGDPLQGRRGAFSQLFQLRC